MEMREHSSDELLQIFSEEGNLLNTLPRSLVTSEPRKYWCAVVNIWLVDNHGKILCSKRSQTVRGNPGKWQTYFGGHLKAGQTFIAAAQAEIWEEIGLTVNPIHFFLVNKGKDRNHLQHFESYAYPFNGNVDELRFSDGEIAEAKWFTFEQYNSDRQTNPDEWCNGCSFENQQRIETSLTRIFT